MDWEDAQDKIKAYIKVDTDLNTPSSSRRVVESVASPIYSKRYGYRNESGFVVPIGQSAKLKIPWSILKKCFSQLNSSEGYSGASFRKQFPLQAKDHPCHVHVVGRIFVVAGLARADGKKYHAQ